MNKKKKSSSKSGGMLARYKSAKTKGNLANTGLKSLVDLVVGATIGAGIGASTGRAALPVGILLIAGSHYFEEETGVLRVAGGATIAYGIGKAIENQNIAAANAVNGFTLAGETTKAKTRLSQFKDEILTAFYLDKLFKKKDAEEVSAFEDGQTVGSIDLSALDVFEMNNRNEAIQYELSQQDYDFEDEDEDEDYNEISGGFDQPEYAYATFDDVDLSNI